MTNGSEYAIIVLVKLLANTDRKWAIAMLQVNMFEAKTNLSKLIMGLENCTNDEIILARNGKPVARITPIFAKKSIIGAGASQIDLPSVQEIEALDEEFLTEFEEDIL